MEVTLPTGRSIALELVKEMEARLYPLVYRVLAPSVYHVYVHPEDYREIEAIAPAIVQDAQRALDARVEARNARSRWSAFVRGHAPRVEVPPGGWEISLHADANGEIERGELGIVSRLSLPPAPRFEGGTPTTRIVRTVVTGTIRRSTQHDVAGDVSTAQPGAASPQDVGGSVGDRRELVPSLARLTYTDNGGAHVFIVRKDLVSIGRGGSAHWVDVQVLAGPRVSREHCRIRRDADGRFFLQDVSTWGTSVDGTRVLPYVRPLADGQIEEKGAEHELRDAARIQLADAVVLDFRNEARQQ